MTQTAVSWNEVRGIHFSFGPNFTANNRQSDLNAVFSRILPNIASLFLVDDDGVETLRPDPIPVLKSLIVAAIMDELPPSEVSKAHKRHISSLIANTTLFWHSKAIGGRIRVRDNQVLDIAAQRAQRGHPIINLVLHTMHWKLHKDWYPYEFHKVYTTTTGIPSDETGLSVKPPSRSRLHRTKPTAPVVSETLPVPSHPKFAPSGTTALVHTKTAVSNPIQTTSALLPVQATDSILDTPAPSSNLINPSLNPVTPAKPNADTAVKICLPHMTQSFDDTNLDNPNSADQPVDCQVADTPTANAPMPNQAPHYAWTWIYSPNSVLISF
eukprot:jgi/Psemu1/40991/gm1.40991_g